MRISDIVTTKRTERIKSQKPDSLRESPSAERREFAVSAFLPTAYALKPAIAQTKLSETRRMPHARIRPTEIYSNLTRIARSFLEGISQEPVKYPDLEEICEAIEWIMEGLEFQPSRLLEFVERSTPEDYLPGHTANVTVLSTALAQQMGWPKERQRILALGALLHDAGMVAHRSIYSKPAELNCEEKEAIMSSPQKGAEALNDFFEAIAPKPREVVRGIVLQSKERISGNGFPNKLPAEQILVESQIVGLCSTYEALTHPRPFRGRKLPHDTLRQMIELSGESFDGGLIKTLWETLTLFPPGSFVKLNTGETAKVIDLNKTLPTRPIVKVVISANEEKVKEEKIIDLSKTPSVLIEGAVDECSLKLTDKRLLLELRAQKWWFW